MDQYTFEDDKSSSCNDTHGLLDNQDMPVRQRKISRWWYLVLFVNFAALLVNTSLVALLYSKEQSQCQSQCNIDEVRLPSHGQYTSPSDQLEILKVSEYTDQAISMELRNFDDVFHPHNSLYRGNPRKELDLAWQKLMKGFNVRVPSQNWAVPTKQNRTLVHLEDGSNDMMGVPAVLHEIHCLRTIREYLFPEEYPITAKRYPVIPPFMMSVHIDK
ncbi:MAG: hypothetical protein MMC33_006527 [Icmadophila ericetorum]|nr:hypothetical protein [Icmadophila ericetorum]